MPRTSTPALLSAQVVYARLRAHAHACIYPFVHPSVHPSVRPSVRPSVYQSVRSSVLSARLSVYRSVRPSVCRPIGRCCGVGSTDRRPTAVWRLDAHAWISSTRIVCDGCLGPGLGDGCLGPGLGDGCLGPGVDARYPDCVPEMQKIAMKWISQAGEFGNGRPLCNKGTC